MVLELAGGPSTSNYFQKPYLSPLNALSGSLRHCCVLLTWRGSLLGLVIRNAMATFLALGMRRFNLSTLFLHAVLEKLMFGDIRVSLMDLSL
jgi:hypothetical protein